MNKNDDVAKMTISESRWRSKPHKQDYANAKTLLKDFGIKKKIPIFESYSELQIWTKSQIRRCLA